MEKQSDISEELWKEYKHIREQKGELAAKAFLEEEREFIVWHGTRRKEPIEEIKKNGFCTYTTELADRWIEEEVKKAIGKGKLLWDGESIEKRAKYIKGEIRKPDRQVFSVTAIEKDAAGWADRNPEFIFDLLNIRLPIEEMRMMLREMFGPKLKVTLKLKLSVRQVLGVPQDIHTNIKCFKHEDILSIEPYED